MPILLTAGEPAGIGPDITLQTLRHPALMNETGCRLEDIVVIADPEILSRRAADLGVDAKLNIFDTFDNHQPLRNDAINVLAVNAYANCQPGTLDPANSRYVLDCLDLAETLCRQGHAKALVTAPVHKGVINQAGFAFSGHTEYLAAPSKSNTVMMLATESLRVALATTHLPLRAVADAITKQNLIDTIKTLIRFLQSRCHIERPEILVCGLNPHAGEDGHLGMEEIEVITPALEHCRDDGIHITGPLPADTLFTEHHLPAADAVLAMYHDQGLPVLKYSGFGNAVNITLGLPFVRTSVDHGTALELAGSGDANNKSLLAALRMAHSLSH